MAILYIIIFILLLIFLIVNLIKYLKYKTKWVRLFLLNIFSIALFMILLIYYSNLPGYGFMPGLSYLFEVLLSFCAVILYSIILIIAIVSKLILFLLEKKKQGKNYFPKIIIIIAIFLFVFGSYNLILDLKNDLNVGTTNGKIINYDDQKGFKKPIVEYKINNEIYKATIEVLNNSILNSNLGDTIEIHYNKKNPAELAYLSYYENLYIPCFFISIILFIVSIKKNKK